MSRFADAMRRTRACGLAVLIATSVAADAVAQPPVPATTLRIAKSQLKLDPILTQAYAALYAGDLATAATGYTQVLKSEPSNADALHGAAVVALRTGQRNRAEELYRRAVAADPKDAVAQAGLFGLYGYGDSVDAESHLKTLIAAQPEQHGLHFALGNVHAAAGRWPDAQQSFFHAYRGAPDHPDYLFNLAISLDHLRHAKLARRFYEMALSAATKGPASFDPAQVTVRLRELLP